MIQIDMDMPKQCIECPLCKHLHLANSPLLIYACGKGTRPIYSHETAEGVDEFCKMQKPEWCPLKEVKHGKWILPNNKISQSLDEWICDNCNHLVSHRHNYCPNCGAKMEEEYGKN